ncbi:Uu.00g080700.m01.CDS01 [Anthostomella pinea]|uniref:Uu.00g080700.m01.CDS01 n=1 Tax=Anthostomella pinea TaxID=933095 RepID=A0AAI8YGY3_9PEZI|nr:Uu.00g080700.m01.CDS01 [Anthostomella pinea]
MRQDERNRKSNRASRWEIFLYHRHIPETEQAPINQVYEKEVDPDSMDYTIARQQLRDNQKNWNIPLHIP